MDSLAEAAYQASGCSSVTEFVSSPLFCQGVKDAYLGDDVYWGSYSLQEGEIPLQFSLKKLRAREAPLQFSLKKLRAREEPGSLPRFLGALPTCIPSCTHLGLWVELVSLDELAALCQGIASPLCTLRSLDLQVSLKAASTDSDIAMIRLVRDALLHNTSLQCLKIRSALICPRERWISVSLKDLHVELVGDDTLDVLLNVFIGLADNSISLTSISITGAYGPKSELGFVRLAMLDSERQLAITLLTNRSLTSLHLYNLIMPNEAFRVLFSSLNKDPNLTSFGLCGYPYLPGKIVHMLFTVLEENFYITSLVLSYSAGEDWPEDWPSVKSILDSLRVNGTLVEVDLFETPFEGEFSTEEDEALSALLERNRKNAEQMKALKSLHLD